MLAPLDREGVRLGASGIAAQPLRYGSKLGSCERKSLAASEVC
jgi:hypothetical protein